MGPLLCLISVKWVWVADVRCGLSVITKGHQGVRRWKVQFRWPLLFYCGIKSRFHFILLWNQWRISGHEWPSQIDYSQSSMVTAAIKLKDWPQWMTTFWNCGKLMRNMEPNGIYPLKYLFHSDQTFRRFNTVQFSWSVMSDSATPWIAVRQASLSLTNSRRSLKLMSIELVMPSSHLILYRPLLLLPPITPSIRVFSNLKTLPMRWPKYWSFSFSISPSNEHPGLVSFRRSISLLSKGLTRVFSNTTVQKHQFFSTQLSSQSNSHIHTSPLGKP